MLKSKIAIYSSNGFKETFTEAHLESFPITYALTEGTPPRMVNGHPMLPMDKWHVLQRKIKSIFGIKIKPYEPIQYFLNHNKVDLFIAEFGMAGAAVYSECKKHQIPLIVNFYGIDAFGHKVIEENKMRYKEMFNYASCISVQSNSIKEKLLSLNCPKEKIVINSCPPSEEFFNANAELNLPILIFVGRFVEKKAPDLTIKAFNEILKKVPDAKLKMVGDGPLLESSIELVDKMGLTNNVTFLGRLSPDQQLAEMREASIYIQHSITSEDGDAEGLPVAIMEASALGLPVVSTIHSGIPEAVEHEKTGFLVPEKDYHKMSDYAIQLLNSKSLRESMGKEGRNKMLREFTMKLHISKGIEIINKVLNGN